MDQEAELSAGEFVELCAETTNSWLNDLDRSGALKENRGVVAAMLPSGETIVLRRMGVVAAGIVNVEGERGDGTPCFFIAHYRSIQVLSYLVPRKSGDEKREIGFHTGFKGAKERKIEI